MTISRDDLKAEQVALNWKVEIPTVLEPVCPRCGRVFPDAQPTCDRCLRERKAIR